MFGVGVLRRWQDRYPYDGTYHCLVRALQHPAVGREDLAAKYCSLQLGKDLFLVYTHSVTVVSSNLIGALCRSN